MPANRLKALGDPLRIRLGLLMLEAPRTVKELAAALDLPPTRLYYHVRILEEHGLIEVVDRRMVSGIEERRYGPVEDAWSIDDREVSPKSGVTIAALHAVLAAVRAEIDVALHDHAADETLTQGALFAFTLSDLALTAEEVDQLQERLAAIQHDFGAQRAGVPEHATRYRLFLAGYERPGVPDAS